MALARIMGVDRTEEAAAQPPSPSPWDCGSPLYDAFELASVHRVLDTHLMALPFARPPRRPCDDADAAVVLAVAVAKRATARSRRRRRSAVGVAKAATRTGKAVLRSIICGSVACGRRL